MSSRIGIKGNIVIDKVIRDRLGVQPGWRTVQLVRDGHVEIHFLPPVDLEAVFGSLRPRRNAACLADDDALHEATEQAMAEELAERYHRLGEVGEAGT